MSAVYNQTFTIGSGVDLTALDAEQVWNLLESAWGIGFETARRAKKTELAPSTVFNQHYTVLDKSSKTLSTSREFDSDSAANIYKTWFDTNVPSGLGDFTRSSSTVTSGQTLPGSGFVTN